MTNLNFNDGRKTFLVNGTVEITFNPSDFGLISRMSEVMDNISEIEKKYEIFENETDDIKALGIKMAEFDREVREQLDQLFGAEISDKLFGTTNCMSCAGGQPICINFAEAVFPVIAKEIEAEKKKAEKKINKYVSQVKK